MLNMMTVTCIHRHPRNERIGPESSLYDAKQGIKMGVPNGGCDDAQVR